jgi:hypothetical protein
MNIAEIKDNLNLQAKPNSSLKKRVILTLLDKSYLEHPKSTYFDNLLDCHL